MVVIVHVTVFLFSAAIVWFFAGILIDSVNRVAKRFNKTGFSVAFFILGFLTSISEISVATNATIENVPEVSAGNLVGASFVILFFIIPLLAVAGRGIALKNTVSKRNLLLAFAVILLPALLVIDGMVTMPEGILMILAYFTLVYAIHRQPDAMKGVKEIPGDFFEKGKATIGDAIKIVLGAGAIFGAGHFLVEQAVYFATALSVPASLIGLLILSVGTNVPELVVAIRSIVGKHKDIAFGDYLGSAAANTPIFGFLVLANGSFSVAARGFFNVTILMIVGLVCFYFFARSRHTISRDEGFILLSLYAIFLVLQIATLVQFSFR